MITTVEAVDRREPSLYAVSKAGRIIRSGGLVAFPTETVYGLGADALNAEAVAKIYEAKGRPPDNPLILHVARTTDIRELVELNDTARRLMYSFWPGPLTLVLPAKDRIPSITRGGLSTAAIRMPDSPIAQLIITYAGTPIAAPSANLSGRPSPTDADTVLRDMNGKIDMIVDGGSTELGIESTVIDVTDPMRVKMLRPGSLPREAIESVLEMSIESEKSPVNRYRHYAPKVPVKIWRNGEHFPEGKTGFIGLDEPEGSGIRRKIIFTSPANYARGLFSALRELENEGIECIVVQWPEGSLGIKEGLKDRILSAASV